MAEMGDYGLAVDIEKAIRLIARSEVESMRPATRQAIVTSINTVNKTANVVFIGEIDEVIVPYTSTAPAEIGQYVTIGGSTHDRHIVDVMGTDATQTQLDSLQEETLPAFGGIRSAGAQQFANNTWTAVQFTTPEMYRGVDTTSVISRIVILKDGTYRYTAVVRFQTTSGENKFVVRKTWADGTADSDVGQVDVARLNISGGGGEGGSNASGSYTYMFLRTGYVELKAGDQIWGWVYGGARLLENGSTLDVFRIGPIAAV